ncbi:MAG TPA: SDR family NAD(P)-dependent oxidoreductase, partial [Thermoanaerobaculia bacterium]
MSTLREHTPVLHPLLHRNTSDLREQRYSSTFDGAEFFLADHQVKASGRQSQKMLPAVAYLEMARAAVEQSLPADGVARLLELQNIVFMQPVVVDASGEIKIALTADEDDQVEYEIYSEPAGEEIVHCQGRAVLTTGAAAAHLDLTQLEARTVQRHLAPSEVYAACAEIGLLYGPAFHAITAVHQGAGEVLADLRLPVAATNAVDYVLHPSLLDGALQACVGLLGLSSNGGPRLPFALDSVRLLAPCVAEMRAWARYAAGSEAGDRVVKLDIDLCDVDGRVCVELRGFATRAMAGATASRPSDATPAALPSNELPVGLLTLAPVWEAVTPDFGEVRPAPGQRLVVIGGNEVQHRVLRQECAAAEFLKVDARTSTDDIAAMLSEGDTVDHLLWILPAAKDRTGVDDIIDAQDEGVLLGFRLIKALLQEGYGAAALDWTVILNGTEQIGARAAETIDVAHSSVNGLVGSMAKEYANWNVRLIDVAGTAWPWGEILQLRGDARGEGWAYREGQWFRRALVQCILDERTATPAFAREGVYVVIGGAGGVGEAFSEYLIRTYDARVVWIGRRDQDAAIDAKIERLAGIGGQPPLYFAADARSRTDLERIRTEVHGRHGRINGIIHSAIVLADKSLANMGEEQFRAGLAAKVDIAVRTAEVFGRDPLDFILYFSSIQTFFKAPGQSNYAAGCTFADAFAAWQSTQSDSAVKVMNWGYWGSLGVVASAGYQERMAQLGVGSIEPEEGMAGLERLLASPLQQVAMIRTTGAQASRALDLRTGEHVLAAHRAAAAVTPIVASAVAADEASNDALAQWENERRQFEAALAASLWSALRQMLPSGVEPRAWTEAEWKHEAGVTGDYERWLSATLRMLAGHGCLQETAGRWQPVTAAALPHENARNAGPAERNESSAQAQLAQVTLRNLADILRGRTRATDVMFPNSSLELVEGVYKNNDVADYFNGVMANVVARYVEARRSRQADGPRPLALRFLELGAGTGGSSEGILRTLDRDRADVEEYRYSDVSKWFLLHGEQAYGKGRDYLQYAVFDVEKGLDEQGIARGAYDVVLAANVLHATKRMRDTIRNAKAALKENGLLVLNEIGTTSVFTHLTFGLLEGWWAYEDAELRMEGSPGLTADGWKRVLEEEGFRHVWFPAHAAHALGQQIVVAESDGVIRQKHLSVARPRAAPARTAPIAAPVVQAARGAGLVERVEEWLVGAVCELLKVKPDDIDLDVELSEFGFDSISLTGFANHMNQAFALKLMPTLFFEHATLKSVARHLVNEHREPLSRILGGADATNAPEAPPTVSSSDAEAMPSAARQEIPAPRSRARRGRNPSRPTAAERTTVDTPRAATPADTEPIAIIGMSGRFPGAEDLHAFWENLQAGRDSIVEIPADRWDWRAFYGDEKAEGNKSSVKWGAFMDGVAEFDPLFFGISPREAELMDPQQRLTMMYGWKAFEDAGYAPAQLWGSHTGIFVGTGNTGYGERLLAQTRTGIEGYSAAGLVPSVGPNRLSYFLNLHGPSEPVETACSSSLVAVHRAVRSIMSGECDMALVGGVNTLLTPAAHISFSKAGMLAKDGKCKTFSSHADGYVRGEGVGMVVLKKLSAAERDGDQIYGLIRGSAENHGGRAQSLTAPNPQAQAELIKDAYRRAGVSPRSVTYIEAHGTGTALGDPIEVNGLKSAFQGLYEESGETPHAAYCGIGSVKSNIGHLELAAGMAGLIKVLLQMKHRTLVPTLHCDEVNPYIQLDASPFYVVQESRAWTPAKDADGREGPLRAGVSSFGFGGVNAHVVVEEYRGTRRENATPGPVAVVLSARDGERLDEQATQLLQAIARGELREGDLADAAYTLQAGREPMEQRLAMIVSSVGELQLKLNAFLERKSGVEGLYRGEAKRSSEAVAVFRGDDELREAVVKWM